jgi:hypothetical protein
LSSSDVSCPVPASQSQDSNDTVKINCFIVMFLIISCPDIWYVCSICREDLRFLQF